MNKQFVKGLYAITDCETLGFDLLMQKTENVLKTGVIALQYRNKSTDDFVRLEKAKALQKICKKYNTLFLINDDIDLAHVIMADGVHLGKNDANIQQARKLLGPDSIIGISCYNDLDRAISVQDMGAGYVAFGAFFPSKTKQNTIRADVQLLTEAKKKLAVPIVAIGGITAVNGKTLIKAGADILAVVSDIYHSDNPTQATLKLKQLFE